MAVDPSVRIDIAAEFTGKKAFDKAGKSTSALEKNVTNLAKGLVAAFSIKAVVSFAKQAAKAAAEDSKATAVLAQNLKNIGLAYAEVPVESFIKQMQEQTGIVDDQLRPAFSKLAQATMSVTKSQELMGLAFDISSGTGVDFNTVVNTLSQAYLGNTKGLKKLNIQMTATELKTASFAEVQDQLNLQFRGAGKVALESYGGQLQILETAANEAKETIGYALLDALKSLTGETDIKKLAKDIDTAAGAAALFIKLTTKNVSPATGLWGYWESFAKSIPGYEATLKNFAERLDVDLFPTGPLGNFQMTTGVVLDQSATQLSKIEQERAKAERQRLAKEKASAAARLAAAKKEALLKKQQAILSKAAAVFDLTKIQIAAALKGKITEEEKIRLLLMQAIEEENVDKAEVLQKKLEAIQAINAKIAADLLAIGEATDPFAAWVLSLDAAAAILGKMPALLDATGSLTGRGKVTLPTGDGLPGGNDSIFTPDMSPAQIADAATSAAELAVAAAESAVAAVIAADPIVKAIVETANALTGITDIVTNVPETITATGSSSMFNPYGVTPGSSAGYGNAINYNYVTVEVAGSVLTENDFDEVINKAMLNNIRRGFAQNPAGALP